MYEKYIDNSKGIILRQDLFTFKADILDWGIAKICQAHSLFCIFIILEMRYHKGGGSLFDMFK